MAFLRVGWRIGSSATSKRRAVALLPTKGSLQAHRNATTVAREHQDCCRFAVGGSHS